MASADILGLPGMSNAMSFYDRQPQNTKPSKAHVEYADTPRTTFNALKHIEYEAPSKVHKMTDIGLPSDIGISPIALSEPFRLFSQEAVLEMRKEILSEKVLKNYSHNSDVACTQLRGYAPQEAPFTYTAWNDPKTLAIISDIAGIELVPSIDYEIGHINLSSTAGREKHSEEALIADDDHKAIVDWHRDSYPFVCVLMMSDTTDMLGGETALRTGSGEILKIRGPSMGCAIILQGRYIEHQALRAFGGQERITSVTSFRPKSPMVKDDTVLRTVRPISRLPDLYGQVMEYQLENMETRCRNMLKKIRSDMKAGTADVDCYKAFFRFEIDALKKLDVVVIPVDQVKKGHLADGIKEDAKEFEARLATV